MTPEPPKQRIAVLGIDEALRLNQPELARWNIRSIRGRLNELPLDFPDARKVKTLHFDDGEADYPEEHLFAARVEDIEEALAFAHEVGEEPLLIHCFAGISRSTAIAWIIVWDKLKDKPDAVRRSFDIVRRVRPILLPNRHILRLGVEVLAPEGSRKMLMQQFQDRLIELNYPELDEQL